jgi:hypothetical protein
VSGVVPLAEEFLSMFDIALVGNGPIGPFHEQANEPESVAARRPGHDRADVANCRDLSRWRSQLDEMDETVGVRWHRVREVQIAMSDEHYLTGSCLDMALDGLLRDLDG